jgi:hypothetical protein
VDIIIVALLIIITFVVMFTVPPWLMRRAIPQVIWLFLEHKAVGIESAMTVEDLGIKRRGVIENMFRRRDYKPYALSALMRVGVVQMTEDEKLYLSEEKLKESGLPSTPPKKSKWTRWYPF